MTDSLTIACAQINPTVGDVAGNLKQVRAMRALAARSGADLLVSGELMMAGYPPEDLVLKPAFQKAIEAAVESLAEDTADGGPALLIGAPWTWRNRLVNAALLLEGGRVAAVAPKTELPNYGVFDEKRVFQPGSKPKPMDFRGIRLGVLVCEDMWNPTPTRALIKEGIDFLVVLNGSPFEVDKTVTREALAAQRVAEAGRPLLYVNLVGGQDELVFDGGSFALTKEAKLALRAPAWETGLTLTRWKKGKRGWNVETGAVAPAAEGLEAIYRAMTTGLRDYVEKSRFPGVLIGLSGGIDSALSAAVAVDALGAERVHCVMMPSPYTSKESLEDAAGVAEYLGCRLDEINIGPAMEAFGTMLAGAFEKTESDTTEENVQARSRGLTLMALSNKFGSMVLSTGNKSEMSVGYATLYGDMCGGYSVLKDIYKMTVFALCRWRNANKPVDALGPDGPVMPERVITKPPSAELKPDQKDEDSLPPYPELDDILHCLIEGEMSRHDVAERGHAMETVKRIWKLLDRAEYKRRQAPPGVKISHRAFGRDRRYPITNGFTDQA